MSTGDGDAAETETPAAEGSETGAATEDTYGGVFGAFPYAFRQSESRLFRSYVVLGGLAAALATFLFLGSLFVALKDTLGAAGGVFTFARSFVIVVALGVIAPILAPVLLVARRHRRRGSGLAYDRALAAAGFAFLASVYLGLVVSAPPEFRDAPPEGPLGSVVEFLYGLPQLAGIVPLVLAGLGIYLVHRRYR